MIRLNTVAVDGRDLPFIVFDEHMPALGAVAFGVYVVVAAKTVPETNECSLGIDAIAHSLGMTPAQVAGALRRLVDKGLITVTEWESAAEPPLFSA